ncbi:MAG TPA: response regulator [Candidatus Polarisedimenticolia bacterium]|nr:response regulator [Candidatus Polarisedimenticolia bacterium]
MARILVIDDESSVRTMLQEVLADRGHSVAVAADGRSGIALAREQDAQIILLDLNMPGMDGIETLAQIRAALPRAAVIVISGAGDEARARQALSLGAEDYIEKPLDLVYLEQVLLLKIATLS